MNRIPETARMSYVHDIPLPINIFSTIYLHPHMYNFIQIYVYCIANRPAYTHVTGHILFTHTCVQEKWSRRNNINDTRNKIIK